MQLSDRTERRVKLNDLNVLMTVVQAGSMNKAAVLLNTTQPAVSRSIGELERTVGVRLLDRGPQGVEPTNYGRALLDGGAAIFDDLRQTLKRIEFLADPTVGEVRVGCNTFLATSFVSAVIDRLSQRYPRIVFQLVTATYATLHRELSERNLDFCIARRLDAVADERMRYEYLYEDTFFVAAGTQSHWVRRRKIELGDLMNEPWVLPPRESVVGSAAMKAFRSNGLDYPRTTVVTNPIEVRISLMATGRYLSIFPSSILRFPAKRTELRALPVKQKFARGPVEIITLNNRTLSPLAQLFINCARMVANPPVRRK
jgi:DNA-binding transcriptional LysR family regulator